MNPFPSINESEVVLIRASVGTGHILDENFIPARSETQIVFSVFKSLKDCIAYIDSIYQSRNDVEFVIKNNLEKTIKYIRPENV